MTIAVVLAIVFATFVLTLAVRLGVLFARVEGVGLLHSFRLALGLLVLSIASWFVAALIDESGGAPAVLIIAIAPLLALPLIQRSLETSWPRATVVWIAQGAGMIACLIVIAAFLTPGLIQNPAAPRQKAAMADMRNLGVALSAWVVDQEETEIDDICSPSEAEPTLPSAFDLATMSVLPIELAADYLIPNYIDAIPASDFWGNPFEIRISSDDNGRIASICIRCAGADGAFSSDVYEVGEFDRDDPDQDIVWVDGRFIRSPAGFASR